MDTLDLQVDGFLFGAVKSGIRGKDRLDLALIYCTHPASAAAVFTTSQVKAAPVLLGIERIKSGKVQAVLVNSGIANACTGEEGMAKARGASASAALALGIDEELVQVSSTGVIGQQLDMACFDHLPHLVSGLAAERAMDVARAIMTTDTVPKIAVRTVEIGGDVGEDRRHGQGLRHDSAQHGHHAVVHHDRCGGLVRGPAADPDHQRQPVVQPDHR